MNATSTPTTSPAAPEARAALALNTTETEKHLRGLVEKHQPLKGIEVKDKATRDQLHGAGMELRTARTTIEKTAKAARDDATKFSKAVIAAEKELIAITEPLEEALLAQRDAWDKAEAARKEVEAAAERARVLAITERITALRHYLTLASQCRTSERIQALFDKLNTEEVTAETYQEFEAEATQAKAETLARVKNVLDAKLAEETARKAEQERLEQQRREAAEAQARAEEEAKRLAVERAELERQQAELRAAQEELARAKAEAEQAAAAPTPEPAPEPVAVPEPEATTTTKADAILATDDVVDAEVTAQELADFAATAQTAQVIHIKQVRPTDVEIINVLALHYRVHESLVVEWLTAFDHEAASEYLISEFA